MIKDWDDAYANAAYIQDGAKFPEKWAAAAEKFRAILPDGCRASLDVAYGSKARQRIDFFAPGTAAKGSAIFVHGGYWMKFSKADWSHLARGALLRGWQVAMIGYTLAPENSVSGIAEEVQNAISEIAHGQRGPIRLAGHSAGGHLAARAICSDSRLPAEVISRIEHVISISGVHDLRPLVKTQMNVTLRLSENEAVQESPALRVPMPGKAVTCWVGADERPEFVRQNDLLANIWSGLGADMSRRHAKTRHHFNVIDDLTDPESELCRLLAP
jgi:arylformamidase